MQLPVLLPDIKERIAGLGLESPTASTASPPKRQPVK